MFEIRSKNSLGDDESNNNTEMETYDPKDNYQQQNELNNIQTENNNNNNNPEMQLDDFIKAGSDPEIKQ